MSSCAFDSVAFDPVAFDVCIVVVPSEGGGGLRKGRRKKPVKYNTIDWQAEEDRKELEEMKLSQLLAKQLEEQLKINAALLRETAAGNDRVAPIVDTVSQAPLEPPKPPMDPQQKAILVARLAKAREAKEAKAREAEAKRKQMLDNLARARKAKKRKNK